MVTQTYPAVLHMKNFDNLFIELTSKYCNQHCKHCYIDFPKFKKEQDFIDPNLIKESLKQIEHLSIKCIYLTGAEPMTHPDFNMILRMCLKQSNVCICTNGSFINEKKARFLKKVEDESENQIFFKLSLAHYNELKNDDVRYRGAFRHTVFATKFLIKYGYEPIISIANFYKESEQELLNNTIEELTNKDIRLNSNNYQVIPWYDNNDNDINTLIYKHKNFDCEYGRVLTSNGIYVCPFLSNDYRGRSGSNLQDFSKKSTLESCYCKTCTNSKKIIFGIDFTKSN